MLRIARHLQYAAWGVALAATGGSVMLSEALHYVPCSLCWYQRILMFPLVVILGVGILKHDESVSDYALPLSGLGVLVAGYHSLLQWGVIHESIAPCLAAIPCTTKQVNLLGFITIPLLSFLSFAAITACLVMYRRSLAAQPEARS